jgi:hypothetical protein
MCVWGVLVENTPMKGYFKWPLVGALLFIGLNSFYMSKIEKPAYTVERTLENTVDEAFKAEPSTVTSTLPTALLRAVPVTAPNEPAVNSM